jgi:hypothetical protein
MTASMTPNDEQESSSVEPRWGRIESRKEQERMEDLRLWENINIGGYTNQRTTKAYRHGRCYTCSKPVSTNNLDPEVELFCRECDKELMELDCGYRSGEQATHATKKGVEKAEREDEEEWGRIPIPQSDDSDSTDEWLSQEPEQYASTDDEDQSKKGYLNCFAAFLIAPRKDGKILTKEGKIIDVNDGPASNEQQPPTTWSCEVPIAPHATQPYWTRHLMVFQRQQLRKGYRKHNRSKVMIKLMRQVTRYHQTGDKLKDEKESQQ